MGFQWRRLQFFERELLQDPEITPVPAQPGAPKPPPVRLFRSFKPSCSSSGRGTLVFGDDKGVVRVLDRQLSVTAQFQAYDGSVIAVKQLRHSNVLVTLGLDSASADASIKFWRFEGAEAVDGGPVCAKTIRLFSDKAQQQQHVLCFAILEDLTQAAVGLADGAVLIITAPNLLRDRSQTITSIIKQGPEVTNLIYRDEQRLPSLFVVTASTVSSLFVSRREAHVKLIDPVVGAPRGCACLTETKQLVVGSDAVFFYEQEERSVCYGLSEAKRQLLWLNGYLVVIGPDDVPADAPPRDVITVYDLRNKLIAYAAKLDPVAHALIEWNALHVLTAKGQLLRFSELDMNGKMDMLFKKSLFVVALTLAKVHSSDPGYVLRIHQQYGDHLYAKGDFDGAVTQYIETIPRVEPSNVIKRFLEPARVRDLTRYLAALHAAGRASAGHILLLLSCYAQLKWARELTAFATARAPPGLDVEGTIRILLSSGHPLHALRFAQAHRKHDLYLSILAGVIDGTATAAAAASAAVPAPPVPAGSAPTTTAAAAAAAAAEASPDGGIAAALAPVGGALAAFVHYVSALPADAASQALLAHGAILTRPSPAAAAASATAFAAAGGTGAASGVGAGASGLLELCLRVCTRWAPAPAPPLPRLPEESDDEVAAATARYAATCVMAGAAPPLPVNGEPAYVADPGTVAAAAAGPPVDPLILAPLFVDQPLALERFFESLLQYDAAYASGTLLSPAALCALLEAYLAINKDSLSAGAGSTTGAGERSGSIAGDDDGAGGGGEGSREAQIMNLLRTQSHRLDLAQALVLCELFGFEKGLLYLYTKMERYQDVIHHHMERGQHTKLIKTCRRYGDVDSSLWTAALVHFASQEGAFEEELTVVLEAITRQGLMAPLVILQLLARSPTKPISVVRPFLLRALQEEARAAAEDQKETERYEADTHEMRLELDTVRTRATIFKEVDCHRCTNTLSLPAVHFLCMHSFHLQCVADTVEKECPICAPEHRKVKTLKDSLHRSAKQHDQFFKQLEDSHDGFATVADYFGRGAFDNVGNPNANRE